MNIAGMSVNEQMHLKPMLCLSKRCIYPQNKLGRMHNNPSVSNNYNLVLLSINHGISTKPWSLVWPAVYGKYNDKGVNVHCTNGV